MREGNTARRIGVLDVPAVGVGCNSFGTWADAASSTRVVHAALDAGAVLFDTADYYGEGRSEEILGRALARRRGEAVIATKFGIMGGRPGRGRADAPFVRQSLEDSLRRLRTDHVDLYLLHFPDPDTPVAETLEVLAGLVDQGLVREVGVCNATAEVVEDWVGASDDLQPAAIQNEWSLVRRRIEDEVLPACRRHDLAVLPYFPLASGLLTGKYRGQAPPPDSRFAKAPGLAERYLTPELVAVADELADFAEARGHTLLELALSWLAGQPDVATVIAGASRSEQVQANVTAAGWHLDVDERTTVDRIVRGEG